MEATAEKDDQKMSQTRKRWVWAAGAVLLIALGGAGIAMRRPEAPPPPAPEQKKTDTLAIPSAALKNNPIQTTPAQLIKLAADLQVVGSVSYDQDNYAVVGPLLPGRVARLRVGVGDAVKAGQVLAEIESSDVGQAQATFLSARARARASAANARRERDLASQKSSSEREREVAEAAEVSEDAELRAATERLRAFGLSAAELKTLDA